jgi:hypothetical protein
MNKYAGIVDGLDRETARLENLVHIYPDVFERVHYRAEEFQPAQRKSSIGRW